MNAARTVMSAPTFDALQQLIHRVLCEHDRLDPKQTPLSRGKVKRSGKACGMFFQVEGPRLLKTYALWVGEENRVLFYDSAGVRFAEVHLSEGPDPLQAAA